MYSRSSVSSDGKFPPTPSKTYVNLAVVERASEVHDIEEVIKHMLRGQVDEMIKGKKKIEVSDILKSQDDSRPVSLVFVEGPPGIGKSTLAWELCRRWDRKQYDLAVLLRLREKEVQQVDSIAALFPHIDQSVSQSVAIDVLSKEGKGVLFILDGYDELPLKLRHQGLLLKLLNGEILPKCSILVTSRSSATKDLHMACSPQILRHVEILGFTQECITEYADSIFSAEHETLKDFLLCISPSINPIINSLMYIPLNAAIIVHIYRNSRRKGCPIPKTLTQVYTQLCLTLLQRYTESVDPNVNTGLYEFSDLPFIYYNNFLKLAQLAFEQFERHNVVFYSPDVPKELVHFGFLDSVPALYGGGGVSYNFLHFTLQEFLAAYHITQFSNGIDVFKDYYEDKRWKVVWRFVSGLTEFQYFIDSVRCDAFVSVPKDSEYLTVKSLLLNCLFEGQLLLDCMAVFGINKIFHAQTEFSSGSSALDRYALGYCIANCSSTTSWKVYLRNGSGESFMWGLNSSHCGNGVISHLEMDLVFPAGLDSYPTTILSGISHLHVLNINPAPHVPVLLLMKNLTSLYLDIKNITPVLLDAIPRPNVTTLTLIGKYDNFQSSLHSLCNLISSPFNVLKNLTFYVLFSCDVNTKPLCDVLFGPSSLSVLGLKLPYFTEDSFNLLETNTCLTTVHIFSGDILPLQPLSKILQNNKTIEKLRWRCLGVLQYSVASL